MKYNIVFEELAENDLTDIFEYICNKLHEPELPDGYTVRLKRIYFLLKQCLSDSLCLRKIRINQWVYAV